MNKFKVTKKAKRPGSPDDNCFYCREKVGAYHKADCVLVSKKVKIRMTVEYDIEVPAYWDKELVEFSRNNSSWCASNALDELTKINNCICDITTFEYIGNESEPYLSEE